MQPENKAELFNVYIKGLKSDFWRIRKISFESILEMNMMDKNIFDKISNDEIYFVKETASKFKESSINFN
ncbi:MAG: hypothetical protein ACD_79C00167G0002 [uncultured bacterium]|nr:MAG: hypothetical protein ACD_79C00167G0002 [uncultured bacterium]